MSGHRLDYVQVRFPTLKPLYANDMYFKRMVRFPSRDTLVTASSEE